MNKILFIIISIVILLLIEQFCRYNKKSLLEIIKPSWFEDINKFPENDFPFTNEEKQIIKKGYDIMNNTKIIITGLCINIENNIKTLKQRINYFVTFFKDYRFVIFENDSKDKTRLLLKQWCIENPKIFLVKCSENENCILNNHPAIIDGTYSENRMKKMINYRNRSLNFIKKNFSDFDYLMTFDLDIKGPWSIDGIANSFGQTQEWDNITSWGMNGITFSLGIPMYYDPLAYTDENLDLYNTKLDYLKIIYKLENYKKKRKLIPCNSAFAGFNICKMNVIKNIDYTPHDNIFKCEHVIFCNNMTKMGFKTFINPLMRVLVGAQGDSQNLIF